MTQIRIETGADHEAVLRVHREAFGGHAEADLVDALRPSALLSLVAEDEGPMAEQVVGHVLFSTLGLRQDDMLLEGVVALAPLAVLPNHQRRGIGTALMREAEGHLVAMGIGASIVLGDPAYYGRFGYRPALAMGLSGPYDAAGDAFMVVEFLPHALGGGPWRVEYPSAFDGV